MFHHHEFDDVTSTWTLIRGSLIACRRAAPRRAAPFAWVQSLAARRLAERLSSLLNLADPRRDAREFRHEFRHTGWMLILRQHSSLARIDPRA